MKHLSEKKGSALIASLLIAILVGSIAGLYLESARQEYKMAHRARMNMEAINVAEIGAEDALFAITNDDWTGWTSGAAGYTKTITNMPYGWRGEPRWVDVFVETADPQAPKIVVDARIQHRMGFEVSNQIRIDLSKGGLFANGLTARDSVRMNGNQVGVDSYNSNDGAYNAASNRNDNGSVASVSVAVDAVNLQNADVWGYVATGGSSPLVGNNGSVRGADTPGGVKVDPNRVTGDFYAEFPSVSNPPLSAPVTSVPSGNGTHFLAAPAYELSSLAASGNVYYQISGDVTMVVNGDMDLSGGASITILPGSSLSLYISGDLDVTGTGFVNTNVIPSDLIVYSTAPDDGSQTIKVSGNGVIAAAVYAPYAAVEMKGSGSGGAMYGAVIANSILMSGNFEFHFDEALKDLGGSEDFSMDQWRILYAQSDRYSDVLGLASTGL